jgi:hypothetical protein
LSDEQIGHLNDILVDATYQYDTGGNSNGCFSISPSTIPGVNASTFPAKLLVVRLKAAGWDAQYYNDQREGEWIRVKLPDENE